MRNHSTRLGALLLCGLLFCSLPALARGISYTENEARYTTQFADVLSEYTLYEGNMHHANIKKYAEKLRVLGYYPVNRVTEERITPDIGYAISLFKQQMGIGVGPALTPLAQALLDSGKAQPPIVAPVFPRNYSATGKGFTPYTYQQLQRLREGSDCGLQGTIADLTESDNPSIQLTLELEEGQRVDIRYTYPAQSSWFLSGDEIVVFGQVQVGADGIRSLDATLIGFAP